MSEFLLLGLAIWPEQQGMFFTLFLGMYLTTVLGNLLIILLIRLDSRLHTPMYFFLSHLAFTDVSFSSVTIPKMLINMHTWDQSIPYASCVTQIYFFHIFWLALSHTILLAQLSFCADNTISHFFCDLGALLKLSCSDTSLNEVFILTVGELVITLSFIGALVSYGRIGATILRFPSIKGIYKALATCGSHLSVVFLFCGTIMVLHFFPSSSNSNDKDIIASVMYIVVTPMLNTFIYSLRNRDIKGAMGQLLRKEILFSKVTVPYSCSYVIH
ncbi:olfactory receptor 1j2-like [Lynx pardinus]|uniref:Olfactory receptor 1j2-like n=1 Tax=Lynx pardinus TaxID=191816 RepID=A0A485NS90_LYNPA|nr:olfactory receptor 1j2-like [Lynx pardinus]